MIKKSPRTTLAAILVLFVFAALPSVTSADHSWNGYHWARTSNPFTIKTGDNVSSAWDAYLDEAISDWNVSTVLDLLKVAGGTNPRNCRPTAGRIEVCNSKYGNTGWLGIAQIWITGGEHITQAITKVNDTYFNTSTYNTPAWRRLVMCQEIAHDFGLDHQDETFNNFNLGSCMDYTNAPAGGVVGGFNYGPSNEHPNAHDYEQIEIIYQHLDGTTTIGQAVNSRGNGQTPPAMNDLEMDGPRQWGRLVSSSRNGRVQVFELDFGNGNKILTHVFWASSEERDEDH
ncbi:MAG TPA: hypothetical protein VFH15_14495 [Pyrinomonadaceae bacterium]|nr:hypothetical protein [Pyrinomonadaceae bacterium]